MTKIKVNVNYFVSAPELRTYTLGLQSITLMVTPEVFPCSNHGYFYLKNTKVYPKEKVIDVGTGTGIVAIAAAKQGALVHATDISEKAVALAQENALRNGVAIDVRRGSYFAEFNGKYDAIFANLPQEIVPKPYQQAIGVELNRTIDGGRYGNEILLNFLGCASSHMHEQSRLYIMVHSLTDYRRTLQQMVERYETRLIALESGSTKEFVKDNREQFWELNKQGIVNIFEEGGQIKAMVYLFELRLKS